jgi:hypothetical protein
MFITESPEIGSYIKKLGVNYAEMVPILVNCIKELKKEIDELKKYK